MLIEAKREEKEGKKSTTFRLKSSLLDEFRKLCKDNNIKQVVIIENAMKQAIEEIKEKIKNER